MIWNILDRRERQYRWKHVTAFVEPVSHDNSCQDADQAKDEDVGFSVDYKENISVSEAVAWAAEFPFPVTLYLYDLGKGTNTVRL